MPDHHLVGSDPPRLAGGASIPAGAFGRIDAETLQVNPIGRYPERFHRVALAARLDEDAVGLVQQPAQVRRGVLPAGAVAGVVEIAQVQERCEEEWNSTTAGQPQRRR